MRGLILTTLNAWEYNMPYPSNENEENILNNSQVLVLKMQDAYEAMWEYDHVIFDIKINSKYLKVFTRHLDQTGGRVVAFIDRVTGDVYKPAGWGAPAKHVRGNVLEDFGKKALDHSGYSIRYL